MSNKDTIKFKYEYYNILRNMKLNSLKFLKVSYVRKKAIKKYLDCKIRFILYVKSEHLKLFKFLSIQIIQIRKCYVCSTDTSMHYLRIIK